MERLLCQILGHLGVGFTGGWNPVRLYVDPLFALLISCPLIVNLATSEKIGLSLWPAFSEQDQGAETESLISVSFTQVS